MIPPVVSIAGLDPTSRLLHRNATDRSKNIPPGASREGGDVAGGRLVLIAGGGRTAEL